MLADSFKTNAQPHKRLIRRVAVLGSGVMGSRIACHFANIGCEVDLLDIVPTALSAEETSAGLTLQDPRVRNRIAQTALANTLKANPAPLYDRKHADRIRIGNLQDHLKRVEKADWIIEAIIERADLKQALYEEVEKHRTPGTLISTNTSGIPIHILIKGRSEDFKEHFCGTHFFNPPRYLRLLEIIPGVNTKPEVIDFLMHYGSLYLGKETVLCKDTPAFIANRVGIFGIMSTLAAVEKFGFTVSEADALTGTIIGRAKSATFRTLDVVGLDTLVKVATGLYEGLPQDEARESFKIPPTLQKLLNNNWLGDKTKQGYFKKTKDTTGKKEILELNLQDFTYHQTQKTDLPILKKAKEIDNLQERIRLLASDKSKIGEFYRQIFFELFQYVSCRIPEISDEIYRIDQAVCAGFGWDIGPFAIWDALGVAQTLEAMQTAGLKPANWVQEMLNKQKTSFYTIQNGKTQYYDIPTQQYKTLAASEGFIILDNIRKTNKIWGNEGCSLFDLGEGIVGLEFHSKMNTIGAEVLGGIQTAISMAEKSFLGLVIGNDSPNFSAGANLGVLYMYGCEQEYDEIDLMVRQFQQTMMAVRYSGIPVVAATAGLVLGGGCELCLHADAVVSNPESYVGLVEFGAGVIPAGGGSKEMVLRTASTYVQDDPEINKLQQAYMNIATARVSTSAAEALNMNYFRTSDVVVMDRSRLLLAAKQKALELAQRGYTQPIKRTDIRVQGRSAMATFRAGAVGMQYGHYISEHDLKIADKLAWVMSGGNLSGPALVSEDYLLDLEREAFVSLTGEKKTLERIQSILFKGKPLRN
ncbi:MAG: 3-hydroxyacyl-CoA dehydrogenase/enoyl-CoA hydratase family protein [Cytophagales bacterium]|nr:MAG: 3-hydroxyacyl-CoA dehydrogenase/enoyl-CoA hydratase family protein [Cytophagales bacterium]TAF61727.1 MAG: 3-hydroxyacyl-CoA dehydrogenase/enoyl-CoA hydratase family protein [Cytophagales bacterium]